MKPQEGMAWALLAVVIWAGWMPVTRLSVTTNLSPFDLVALRFGAAGLVLLPAFIASLPALRRVGRGPVVAMILCGGAPYSLVAMSGLIFAPASHAASLMPGVMPLFVALISITFLGERISPARWLGLALILGGAACFLAMRFDGAVGTGGGARLAYGHALFLCASFMWAVFTVIMRRSGLSALDATAVIAVGSMAVYLPLYFAVGAPAHLWTSGWGGALQLAYQGLLTSVVSIIAFGRAVRALGASQAAAFSSLVPALTALLAIPALGEWPSAAEWTGVALVSAGVLLAAEVKLGRTEVSRA
jgi:drug/metabolite transporter (DMT)-like permease